MTLMQTSGADLIMTRLMERGTDAVFLVPGAQIDPLCRRLSDQTAPQAIVASHEQSAGFMADGYARASHQVGVCLGIGSCGAANMLPAVAVAAEDCSSVLFLSGNIPSRLQGHGAFQDGWVQGADDSRIFKSLVRRSAAPDSRTTLQTELDQLLSSAIDPFGAPVHLSIPVDMQEACDSETRSSNVRTDHFLNSRHDEFRLKAVVAKLANARRPCLLVGPRFSGADANVVLREFAEHYRIPIATTLSAKGLLPEDHELSLGNFGFSGSRRAHETLLGTGPDVIFALGADFNERDSCCWDSRLRTNGRAILRADSKETGSLKFKADIECITNCVELLRDWTRDSGQQLLPLLESAPNRTGWIEELSDIPRTFTPLCSSPDEDEVIPLDRVVTSLREAASSDTILAVDAGFQRIFAGHYWQATQPDTFHSACGTAPIGWAICAAIGIQIARPTQPVVVLTGDGCMCAHGMELSTMVRYRLPIVVVVCNNGAHGSVSRRLPESELPRLPEIDWVAFANSLGATGIRVRGNSPAGGSLEHVFDDALTLAQKNQCPFVLDVLTPLAPAVPSPEITRSALTEDNCSLGSAAA